MSEAEHNDNDEQNRQNIGVTTYGDTVKVTDRNGDTVEFDAEGAETAALMMLRGINGGSILLDAYTTVQERGRQYGPPTDNWGVTAALKSSYDGHEQDAFDHAIQMILVKAARLKTGQRDRDTLVDIAGYARGAAVVEEVNDE